jgi:hypothetical protein
MKKENHKKIIELLDQIISYNQSLDRNRQKESDLGQSFNIFHLNLLKTLVQENEE